MLNPPDLSDEPLFARIRRVRSDVGVRKKRLALPRLLELTDASAETKG